MDNFKDDMKKVLGGYKAYIFEIVPLKFAGEEIQRGFVGKAVNGDNFVRIPKEEVYLSNKRIEMVEPIFNAYVRRDIESKKENHGLNINISKLVESNSALFGHSSYECSVVATENEDKEGIVKVYNYGIVVNLNPINNEGKKYSI